MGWQEGEKEESLRLFSEIISPDSFTLTIPFAMGAARGPGLESGSCIRAPSRIPPRAPVAFPDFVMWQVGCASLKSTVPVSTSFLILRAYHELFKLFIQIFLWYTYYCPYFMC